MIDTQDAVAAAVTTALEELPLQTLVDMHEINVKALADAHRAGRNVAETEAVVNESRRLVFVAARRGLKPGEIREVRGGKISAKVFTVGTGQTTCQTRRDGELLAGMTSTRDSEDDALRLFRAVVMLITDLAVQAA